MKTKIISIILGLILSIVTINTANAGVLMTTVGFAKLVNFEVSGARILGVGIVTGTTGLLTGAVALLSGSAVVGNISVM